MSDNFTGGGDGVSWNDAANWSTGVPGTGTYVDIGNFPLITVASGDTENAITISATGTTPFGTANTLELHGTLLLDNSQLTTFTDYTLRVDATGELSVGQLSLIDATDDIFGFETIVSGGGGVLTDSYIHVEQNGILEASELGGDGGDTIVVDGTLHLTGGGPGTGHVTIDSTGYVQIDGSAGAGAIFDIVGGTFVAPDAYSTSEFDFSGPVGGTVAIYNNAQWNTGITITGFNEHDVLILGTVVVNGDTDPVSTVYDSANHTASLIQSGQTVVTIGDFTLANGATGVTAGLIDINGVEHYIVNYCFYADTMLAMEDGEIAVQDVREGTMLKTADGKILPVRWVGWSDISLRFADKQRALPIRITAGALGENIPGRDLLVSPDHAIYIDGVLAHASALVNGTSILQETNVPENFRYYHVELATHELLLAENCPAESFVDNVDRMNFTNWNARETPHEPVQEMDLPRAKSARQLPAALRTALAHFAARSAA